ncbi:hypothetical protein CCP2SC5_1040014 [Azospirillaceae bacterium]
MEEKLTLNDFMSDRRAQLMTAGAVGVAVGLALAGGAQADAALAIIRDGVGTIVAAAVAVIGLPTGARALSAYQAAGEQRAVVEARAALQLALPRAVAYAEDCLQATRQAGSSGDEPLDDQMTIRECGRVYCRQQLPDAVGTLGLSDEQMGSLVYAEWLRRKA